MEGQIATGFLPYELKDVILLVTGEKVIVTDIKMIQTIKDKKVWFEIEVNNECWIKPIDIKERIKL